MGLPSISIHFKTQGASAITRSQKGAVGLILRDSTKGNEVLMSAADVPAELSQSNRDYISRTFLGYVNPPKKVLVCVLEAETELTEALNYFATQELDYLAGPPEITKEEATAVSAWIKSRRAEGFTAKAVLPDCAADNEGVVNFATTGIKAGGKTYTAAEYCSRIAGLIAGTPMTISCTYAPLPEVEDVTRLSEAEINEAVDAGKLILFHDGKKVKTARGVNSLVTVTPDKGAAFQKIKTVEAVDMIRQDIRITAQDSYIGKYSNSYDNKCLLISAIQGYFEQMQQDGILKTGSTVGIDLAAQEAYLKSIGTDIAMSEQEIKEADTGSKVFLSASIKILDAVEDISLNILI